MSYIHNIVGYRHLLSILKFCIAHRVQKEFLVVMRTRVANVLIILFGFGLFGSSIPLRAKVDFRALERLAPQQRVEETIDFFAGLGSRVAGYPGAEASALYIQDKFEAHCTVF